MKKSREEVLADMTVLLRKIGDDWEYSSDITEDTNLIADMGLESLAVVVLGAAVQEQYNQVLPFHKLFAQIGQRDRPDISVREWVDFIYNNLGELSSTTREGAAKP
jgi:acyl carrier protein